jgi:hypothetical protein
VYRVTETREGVLDAFLSRQQIIMTFLRATAGDDSTRLMLDLADGLKAMAGS